MNKKEFIERARADIKSSEKVLREHNISYEDILHNKTDENFDSIDRFTCEFEAGRISGLKRALELLGVEK
jgi:hypothetical protein